MKNYILATLVALFFSVPAMAQEAPPEGGTPKPFNLPEGYTFTLDNGLRATLIPYGVLPKVTAQVIVRTGNIHEESDQVWLADMMADLMQEGTSTRNATDIAKEAAQMGGSVNIGVGLDQTYVTGDVLSEFGADVISLMADVIRNPSFPADELDRLKRDRVRQLNIQQSQPSTKAFTKFRETMYGDHPYGRMYPTEDQLNGYTVDDIQNFYDTNVGAARAHVYVSGKFNQKAVEKAIRDAFEDWNAGPSIAMVDAAPTSSREIYLEDIPGAAQSNVYIGLPVIDPSHPDYMALQVTNSLLGGSFGSRITSNIREDKGYTYSPYSQVSSRYRDAYWAQVAAVTTNVTGAAIEEIFKEIDMLQAEPPPAEELEGIQNYMAGTFVLQNSSRGGIINQLAFLELHELDKSYLTNYVDNIYAVTPEDVQRIMQEYIVDENMMIVIAGDVSQIQDQVAQFEAVAN